jgi:2'-5' RNA ligase
MKFIDLLLEESTSKFEYGCVMLYFNLPEISKIHSMISKKDIYTEEGDRTYGLEDEPHTTLLFGLHEEVTTEDIKKTLKKFTFGECSIGNASLFKNEKYDVLKFDVTGDSLHEANAALCKYPHTNDYPDYHPHLTIGYIAPGKGDTYTKALEGINYKLNPTHAVYSKPDGSKDTLKINIASK